MQLFEKVIVISFIVFIILPFIVLMFLMILKYLIEVYRDIRKDLES